MKSRAVIRFDENLAGEYHSALGEMPAVAFPLFVSEGHMRMDEGLPVLERDIADQLCDLHRTVEGDELICAALLVIESDTRFLHRADCLDPAEPDAQLGAYGHKLVQQVTAVAELPYQYLPRGYRFEFGHVNTPSESQRVQVNKNLSGRGCLRSAWTTGWQSLNLAYQ
jgi:hypothetical protein